MSRQTQEPIAIIGSGCRFPGEASSPSKLWDLLHEPRDLLREIPADRFSAKGFYHRNGLHHGNSNVQHGYFLSEDFRHFDAKFFGIKGVEANAIDPQQRILLETVYEGVEAAGLRVDSLRGSNTAVYVGLMCGDYEALLLRDLDTIPTYHATGIARSVMANRVSYFFDWHGPSMTIDTACSSSLVAVHQAVQSLRSGESRMAIAAGSNLILGPENFIAESKLKMLSPTGRSRMWDRNADGYARGEGVASVVLKTLSTALADGDHIECLVRETGVNQDGRTRGITMPSATAQTSLIRDTYAKAGLDLRKQNDRCQYFEAHGTGTPTGDPLEAEAVATAFFPDRDLKRASDEDPLFVGSIKTVIGHTEGTAGLAALLKASLALQNGVLPPNMLFDQLNPAIKPFYDNLCVVRKPRPWPCLAAGNPRRASVNSFGFGGTNAHAILESYEPPNVSQGEENLNTMLVPFAFSANTESSLVAQLKATSAYLSAKPSVDIQDLNYTLNHRRTVLPIKVAFPAQSPGDLLSKIRRALDPDADNNDREIGIKPTDIETPSILGIFTGQGAQYARMGAEILLGSSSARRCIEALEESLNLLPESDRPQWSLKRELLADSSSSRVQEAAISQPLCTALQILLVDMVHQAGIKFKAVVGHSSGEIAAAYAAGFIAAQDAIRIAYYRGLHSNLASGQDGVKGAMMAVATSMEDAQEICELPEFDGRITIAAVNSAASVTLSGDEDAITEAKIIFSDEKKKATILKVDKAYHSLHMRKCSSAYMKSMEQCVMQLDYPRDSECVWYSSVNNKSFRTTFAELSGQYWVDNLVHPVMFKQALTNALEQTPSLSAIIEIGSHPALKGPALQTIQDVLQTTVPYTGLLQRGVNSCDAFAEGVGYLWQRLGERTIDLTAFNRSTADATPRKLITDLPTYQWDHNQLYWQESRVSHALRTREGPVNELLGSRCPDGTAVQKSWKNLLHMKEVPWIRGHALQGQTVFPAAGYVATAIEASKSLPGFVSATLLEISSFVIHQPLIFNNEESAVETLFSFFGISAEKDGVTSASFTYHSASAKDSDSDSMALMASGQVRLMTGTSETGALPERSPPEPNMIDVEADHFYDSLDDLGYGYTGDFRALSGLQRKSGRATGVIKNPKAGRVADSLTVHPAMLDAAIQSVILAYCYPNDGQLWSLHLPTSIEQIRIDLQLCARTSGQDIQLPFDSTLSQNPRSGIYGDVTLYTLHSQQAFLQVEGMRAVPFTGATSDDDRTVFSKLEWGLATPDGETIVGSERASPEEYDLAYTLERVAFFYLRSLDQAVAKSHKAREHGPYVGLFNYANHVNSWVCSGAHPYAKAEWTNDSQDLIFSISNRFPHSPDLQMMHIVGREMPRVIHGETTILEHLLPNNLLDNYYSNALGFPQFTEWLSRMVAQLSHRYPRMKILEVGAGTGGATKGVLKHIDHWYTSYTFTDISNGFFESAQETFKDHSGRMTFKILDLEKDISAQGFEEGAYDLVIASFVLHATARLEHTMANARRLLKPGGYIVMAEVTNNDQIRGGFIFGALPGWWLGIDDGRVLSPCVSPSQWDAILRKTGFSGVDTITTDDDKFPYPGSVMLSQAIDPQISLLRRPLSAPWSQKPEQSQLGRLLIIGGRSLATTVLVEELSEILARFFPKIDCVGSISEVSTQDLISQTTVLCLAELDEPIFKNLTAAEFEGFKYVLSQGRIILWITQGRRAEVPESNMTYGFVRSQLWEVPDLRIQFIDFESASARSGYLIAENLIRFSHLVAWEKSNQLEKVLWSVEPEQVFEQGRLILPRLHHWEEANERLNSSKRRIARRVIPREEKIGVENHHGSPIIARVDPETMSLQKKDCIDIQVDYSLSVRTRTILGNFFIVLGTAEDSKSPKLALADTQAIANRIPRIRVMDITERIRDIPQFMLLVDAYLTAKFLLSKVSRGETLMVHEPDILLSRILQSSAVEMGIFVFLTSSNRKGDSSCKYIHPCTTQNDIAKALPSSVALFVDLSGQSQANVGARIAASLASSCDVECWNEEIRRDHRSITTAQSEAVQTHLNSAYVTAMKDTLDQNFRPDVALVSIDDLQNSQLTHRPARVIDWAKIPSVEVDVQPIDQTIRFSKDKTYWLVGLTGSLGLSLCDWMVRQGAKHIVLSSRNPKIDQRWTDSLAVAGVNVKVFASDITDREAVQKLFREICSTMPTIGGVAQGAMLLHDTPTRDMSFQDLERVLKPKVDGSRYLNELFQENNLDFFVFFSSMTGIVGNMGQANYTAANAFMCALANQRRSKGLAASVINIGVIIGAGYVTREVSHADQKNLRKGGYMWMSERDFHQIFAEAVLNGSPDSGEAPEISTGLRRMSPNEPYKPIWYDNPVFSKCILQQDVIDTQENQNSSGPPIRTRLQAATNESQVASILEDCFTTQLEILLGGSPGEARSQQIMLESRTDELGIDSLIAVEIRSWFLNNLGVNVPVLKILGGAAVKELTQFALLELPRELVPNIVAKGQGDLDTAHPEPRAMLDIAAPDAEKQDNSSGVSAIDPSSDSESSNGRNDSTPASPASEMDPEYSPTDTVRSLIEKELPISSTQSMFWFVTAYLQDKTTLNHFGCSRVVGELRTHDLQRAVDVVAQRHEALRTCFFTNEKHQQVQGILETSPLHLVHKWIKDDAELHQECSKLKRHVYDLTTGETMKIVLLLRSTNEHYLLIGCHHINIDGISHQVLMSDLQKAYDHQPFNDYILQYPEYSRLQAAENLSGKWKSELKYWEEELRNFDSVLPILSLSSVKSRRELQEYQIHKVDIRLDSGTASRIRDVCRRYKATPFHFYLSVFKALLFRYCNTVDLCIGMADGNRPESSMLDSIGPFVNLIPLRFRREPSQTFQRGLEEARTKAYRALSNSVVPFETLLNEFRVARSPAYSPLFQAFIDYRQGAREKMSFGECQLELIEFTAGRTAYDLSLDIIDDPAGQPLLTLMAQTSIYSMHDAEILTRAYANLIETFSREPDIQVDHAPLYKPADTMQALDFGRGTLRESGWPETLPHRMEEIFANFGDRIALKDVTGDDVTYRELSYRSDAIAAELLDHNITESSIVAVFQEPSADWIYSLLAIIKIGATYLPLDPGTPLLRLAVMATDARVRTILVNDTTQSQLEPLNLQDTTAINVSRLASSRTGHVPVLAKSSLPIAVLYTSGSTGAPKGIVLKHESFLNEVEISAELYGLGFGDTTLQQSALGFDMSLLQIFLALALGGTLCLLPRSVRGDPMAISELIYRENVSFTCATPSEYINWVNYGSRSSLERSAWRTALSGGEPVSPSLLQLFRSLEKAEIKLFNGYGPTETTCCSTKLQIDYNQLESSNGSIAIGKPSPNESIYILDERLQPVPVGVPGEIVIGGVGVAIGYLNDEQLASEKFVPDRFANTEWLRHGWTTMYRSGDRGRWRDHGTLSLEGRLEGDTQIKLRGLRIELREVEEALIQTSHGALTAAIVSARSDDSEGPKFLVAHVVFRSDLPHSERHSLLKTISPNLPLPQYMHPTITVELNSLPVNSSGKVDRRTVAALPITAELKVESDTATATSFMSRMKEVWKATIPAAAFDHHHIEAASDFFHVGGNSMLLVKLRSLIEQVFGVPIPLPQLFATPTLAQMAERVEAKSETIGGSQIDWSTETEPNLEWDNFEPSPWGPKAAFPARVVVLTGATGFLGPYLLSELVENPQVERVHCLAVRSEQSRQSLREYRKTIVHEGDLTLPLLGLSQDAAGEIFREADVVIHNGADVSHLKTYQTLRLANLDSTKELFRLSLARKIPTHYVSTAGVAMFTPRETFKEISVSFTLPPRDGSDGYTASKWASERFLERASQHFNLPVWIHRPSSITRSSSFLGEDATDMELLQNLLKYSRLMHATPVSEKLQGALDLVTAEHVAEGIVGCAIQEHSPSSGVATVSYVHQTGDFCLPISGLKAFLETETKTSFQTLSLDEWADKATSLGLHVAVAAAFKNVENLKSPMVFPSFVKGK